MKQVEMQDLQDLSLGAALLGSGGGGSPEYDLMMAESHFMKYGNANLADIEDLKTGDLVVPIAFAGAPLVGLELLPSGRECDVLFELIESQYGKKPDYLMPAEIGGANALAPFLYASRLGIPVLDADTIGRAFPEMQMSSCNVHGVNPSPAFLIDALDNSVIVKAEDADSLESIARKNIVQMGSSALIGIYLMDGELAKKAVIGRTVSQAIRLGKAIREAKKNGNNPLDYLEGTEVIGCGIIDNIDQSVEHGFLNGTVTVMNDDQTFSIHYQNEYLKVESNGRMIAATPKIIALLDSEAYVPITSEKLLFGMRVTILTLPSPTIWMTESGLKLVGPQYFGYEEAK